MTKGQRFFALAMRHPLWGDAKVCRQLGFQTTLGASYWKDHPDDRKLRDMLRDARTEGRRPSGEIISCWGPDGKSVVRIPRGKLRPADIRVVHDHTEAAE
jgi:hypothetical protein